MLLFWRQGYEGTSISQLTAALGINAPSLYAAFGSKERLYQLAVEYYMAQIGDAERAALAQGSTVRGGIEALLQHCARAYTEPGRPRGCMIALGGMRMADEHHAVLAVTQRIRKQSLDWISGWLEQGRAAGELPAVFDVEAYAHFLQATLHGMAVLARDGASVQTLQQMVRLALAAWPGR